MQQVTLFGPDIYHPSTERAHQLCADIRLVPELKKIWSPDMPLRLFRSHNPVGDYNSSIKSVIYEETLGWSQKLKDFPPVDLAVDAPSRLPIVPRDNILLAALIDLFPVPNTPFWCAVAENISGYGWCQLDTHKLCRKCVHGTCSCLIMFSFFDYFHFAGELHEIFELCAQRVTEYIAHVHRGHTPGGPEYKIMDSWFTAIQSVYLDVLHSKAESLQFPGDELRSIQYRLINSGGRSVAQHVSQEHNTSVEDATIIDAVAFAGLLMHDICDCRHDNKANEFYNLLTIVSGHHGVQSTDILRRFCVDVWSWALDTGNLWAIHFAGRMLIWQMYIARYQTSILLDNIHPPTSPSTSDPYGDPVLNSLNPLPPSEEPRNFSIRSRCQNVTRYDNLLDDSLKHFEACSHCRGFETATWQERVPIIGAAYKTKYTDITCVNMLATYMVLASPSELWWLPEPTAQYTGPTSEWSPLLG